MCEGKTIFLNNEEQSKNERNKKIEETIIPVYELLKEKGYHPISQIVGYIMSGDPTYITAHKGARSLITKVAREDVIEMLLEQYLKEKKCL